MTLAPPASAGKRPAAQNPLLQPSSHVPASPAEMVNTANFARIGNSPKRARLIPLPSRFAARDILPVRNPVVAAPAEPTRHDLGRIPPRRSTGKAQRCARVSRITRRYFTFAAARRRFFPFAPWAWITSPGSGRTSISRNGGHTVAAGRFGAAGLRRYLLFRIRNRKG